MSNTDGEYTLRIEKEAIAFADSIEVNSIATHTGLVKGYIAGAKELASLREQLAKEQKTSQRLNDDLANALDVIEKEQKFNEMLSAELDKRDKEKDEGKENLLYQISDGVKKLKQKEDENRELLDSISQLIYAMNTTGLPWNTDSTAEKAYANCRSLLKKHIG